MVVAIIVAAGSSRRMGFDKVLAPLAGRPVVAHAIEAFENCAAVDEIILVAKADRIPEMRKVVRAGRFAKVTQVIEGGPERHLSVWNGLQAVPAAADLIAIHDGARPLTTTALIDACIALAKKEGAACCACPIPDTVKRASRDGAVAESVDRGNLWAMQTPQVFTAAVILQAYAALIASGETASDEVSAVQRLGKKIALLHNTDWNFKITVPGDLELAEHVLAFRLGGKRKAERARRKPAPRAA